MYRDRVNRDYIRGLSIIKGSPKPVERKPWMCADYSRMMGPVYSSVDPTATKTDPTVTKTDPTAAKADSVSGLKWGYRGSTIREDEGALFELQDEDHPSTFTCHIDGEMAAEYIQGLDAITAAISDPIEWRRATQEFKKAFYNKHFSVDVVDRGDTPAPDSLLNAHTALRKFSEVSSNGTIS